MSDSKGYYVVAQLCKWEQLKNEKGGGKIIKNQAVSILKRCSDQRKHIENLVGQLFSLTYLHIFIYSWPFFSELPWNEELKCRFLFLTTITIRSHPACSVLITKTFTLTPANIDKIIGLVQEYGFLWAQCSLIGLFNSFWHQKLNGWMFCIKCLPSENMPINSDWSCMHSTWGQ